MEEAEAICDRLAIMDHGKLLALDTPRNLINGLEASYTVKVTMEKPMTKSQLNSMNGGIEIIEGLHKPTSGNVSVFDLEVQSNATKVKALIGVQLQASAYYSYLNLKEILALLGSFYPHKASPELLLDQVGLADKSKNRDSE